VEEMLLAMAETPLHIVNNVVVVFLEAFSIHPFVPSSTHPWHHTGKKILTKINNEPRLVHVLLSIKGMPGPRGEHPQDFVISISSSIS
jgi:hypothetical protein